MGPCRVVIPSFLACHALASYQALSGFCDTPWNWRPRTRYTNPTLCMPFCACQIGSVNVVSQVTAPWLAMTILVSDACSTWHVETVKRVGKRPTPHTIRHQTALLFGVQRTTNHRQQSNGRSRVIVVYICCTTGPCLAKEHGKSTLFVYNQTAHRGARSKGLPASAAILRDGPCPSPSMLQPINWTIGLYRRGMPLRSLRLRRDLYCPQTHVISVSSRESGTCFPP